MNGFKYDNVLIKLLTTMANMLIVSFYWLITSIPLVTIMCSSAALYKTCIKAIFIEEKGEGITSVYFKEFKDSLKPGIVLSLIVVVAAFFIYTGIDTGLQIYKLGELGLAYLVLGIVITVACLAGVIYLPAVISRFEVDVKNAIRLSFYLSSINLLETLWFILLLAGMVWTIDLFPLIIVIMPALYIDMIRVGVERKINKYIVDNHLVDDTKKKKKKNKEEDIDSIDIEKNISKKKNG